MLGGKILSLVLYCIHTEILEGVNVTTHLVVGKHITKVGEGRIFMRSHFIASPTPVRPLYERKNSFFSSMVFSIFNTLDLGTFRASYTLCTKIEMN